MMKRLIESDAGSSSRVAVPIYLLLSAPFLFTRIEVAAEPLHQAVCLHTTYDTLAVPPALFIIGIFGLNR